MMEFIKHFNKLASIYRATHIENRAESTAEHTTLLLGILYHYKEEIEKIADYSKVLELALIHDLPESITGDFKDFNRPDNHKDLEQQAIASISNSLKDNNKLKRYSEQALELSEMQSKETLIVALFDKLTVLITESENVSDNLFYTYNHSFADWLHQHLVPFFPMDTDLIGIVLDFCRYASDRKTFPDTKATRN